MNFIMILLDGFVLISSAIIWIVILLSIYKTFNSGDVVAKFNEKMTNTYLVIGIFVFAFSIFNIYTLEGYSLGMKIINWVAFPTLALEFIYFGVTRIQFREKAFIWNNFVTKYENIESYKWELPNQLLINRKNCIVKKIRITVRPADKEEIEKNLKPLIGKKVKAKKG